MARLLDYKEMHSSWLSSWLLSLQFIVGEYLLKLTEVFMKDRLDGCINLVESNNGFDGVFINESTGEVIINESKQWTGSGVSLSKQGAINPATGIPWPAQMTDDWVDAVAQKLIETNNPAKAILAGKILNAKGNGLLTKIVTVVDRTPAGNANNLKGGINIIKVK